MNPKINALHIVLNNFVNDSRVQKECNTLLGIGILVTVFALHEEDLPYEEKTPSFIVHRFYLATRHWSKNPLIQLIKYFECLVRMTRKAMTLKPDVIHAHDLAALPIGILMAKMMKASVIYDAHEFETEQVEHPNRLLHFLSVRLERFLVRRADAVITVSEGIAGEYARRYGIPKPRLALNCPPFQVVRKFDKFREKFAIGKDQTIFLYQGGLLRGRGIENLMDVFSRAVRKDIVLVVIGSGPLEGQIREAAERCGNIFFHPAVPSKELLPYTASADVGFLPIPNNCLSHYYCLPNKFFEYAMAGLPILVNDLPEMKRLVDMYRCGVVMASDTAESIFAAVEKIMAEDRSVYSANARKLAERYNWEEQEKVLLSVYREVLSCAV